MRTSAEIYNWVNNSEVHIFAPGGWMRNHRYVLGEVSWSVEIIFGCKAGERR